VINLDRSPSMMDAFLRGWTNSDMVRFDLHRQRAVDAAAEWPRLKTFVQPDAAALVEQAKRPHRRLHADLSTIGTVGCTLSHLLVWLDILGSPGDEPFLVFEDDARISSDTYERAKDCLDRLPPDWDLFLIGYNTSPERLVMKSTALAKMLRFFGTHAYVIRRAAILKAFEHGILPIRIQFDSALSLMAQTGALRIYAPTRRLVKPKWHPTTVQEPFEFWKILRRIRRGFDFPAGSLGGQVSDALMTELRDLSRSHPVRRVLHSWGSPASGPTGSRADPETEGA
jgi:hypothetical protein